MVLNEALKRHRRCVLECEKKYEFCEYDLPHDHNCDALRDACNVVCDFDHSPN